MTVQNSPTAPAQGIGAAPAARPLDRLYRAAAGNRALAVVLILLTLTGLAGVLLPQLPSGINQDDAAARWLAETSSRFGGLGTLLNNAGLFDLWHSAWFRGLMDLLAFLLLLRLGLVLGDAVQRLRHPNPAAVAAEARRWPLQSSFSLEGDLPSTLAGLGEDLRNEGWRVASSGMDTVGQPVAIVDAGAALVAERSAWSLWAQPLVIVGVLVVLAGLWLGQLLGWREPNVTLVPGQPVQLSHSGLSVAAAASNSATPANVDTVTVQPANGQAVAKPFSRAGSAHLAGVAVRRTGEGQALAVSAQDPEGNPVQLQQLETRATAGQPELNLVFDQPRAERVVLAPARQLVVSIVAFPALPERGFSGPTFLVQAFEMGRRDPIYNQFIEGDANLTIDGDVYQLRTGQFVDVEVSRNPGAPVVWAGALLALTGLLLSLLRPAGRLSVILCSRRDGAEVVAHLQPSLAWRQASRWLAAWTETYGSRPDEDARLAATHGETQP